MSDNGTRPVISAAKAVLNKDREALLAAARQDYDSAYPAEQPGIPLLLNRQTDVEARIAALYQINGRHTAPDEYFRIMGKLRSAAIEMLELYVSSARWENLPPHVPYTGRDLIGTSWRIHMAVLKAFIARDKKKIAAAIRKADRGGLLYLPYAIVCEARKMGLDPKIKKFDF